MSFRIQAQETANHDLGTLVDQFYAAISEKDSAKRAQMLMLVTVPKAEITSIIYENGQTSIVKGDVSDFLSKTSGFYREYSVSYDESVREAEYYMDLASVHSISTQMLMETKTFRTYNQDLWLQLDCVFVQETWKVASAYWTNRIPNEPIERALYQDTLWHLEK